MDTDSKLEELKTMLRDRGVDLSDDSSQGEPGTPTTRIAQAAVDDLMVAGGGASVWVSWSKSVKQLSGESTCTKP
jgi:hypothetical protein